MAPNIRHPRSAFTLVELMLVSCLMTLLTVIVGAAWSGFGRPMLDALSRGQILHEANLAASALARDFGGCLPGSAARLGDVDLGRVVGRMQPTSSVLRLCFDGGPVADGVADWAAPDTVITYQLDDGNLIRWDENSGATFLVARYVQQFELTELGNGVEIRLTFAHRDWSRTYTLVGLDP